MLCLSHNACTDSDLFYLLSCSSKKGRVVPVYFPLITQTIKPYRIYISSPGRRWHTYLYPAWRLDLPLQQPVSLLSPVKGLDQPTQTLRLLAHSSPERCHWAMWNHPLRWQPNTRCLSLHIDLSWRKDKQPWYEIKVLTHNYIKYCRLFSFLYNEHFQLSSLEAYCCNVISWITLNLKIFDLKIVS